MQKFMLFVFCSLASLSCREAFVIKRFELKFIKSILLLSVMALFVFSCQKKAGSSGTKQESKIARFLGDYVTPSYFKRQEGYDWMAYTIAAHTPDTLKIEMRSRVDIKKPTCTFSGLATRLNDSALTHEITDRPLDIKAKILFTLSNDTLHVSANDFNNRFALMSYCSGGGSLAGAYVKLKQPLDTFQLTLLTLKENALGSLKLQKGMTITEDTLKKHFPPPYEVIREIGEREDGFFILYTINYRGKTLVAFHTEDTESHKLAHVFVSGTSFIQDQYGMQLGYAFSYLKSKRPGLKLEPIGYHFHIYLYEENSHIAYEMTQPKNDGPDRRDYTLEQLEGTKIIDIIWH